MSVFFLVAVLLALLVFFWLMRAWGSVPPAAAADDDPEWQVMLARRREIEEDPQLSAETRAVLRQEWLETADAVTSRSKVSAEHAALPSKTVLSASFLLVLLIAAGIYAKYGQFEPAALQFAAPAASPEDEQARQLEATMAESIAKLEARLKEKPEDVDGWSLLARSYFFTGNYAAAAATLERLLKLKPGDPAVLTDLADALAASTPDHILAGRPINLVQQALSINPRQPKALALAATYAMQNNQSAEAISYWRRLRALMPPDGEEQRRIDEVLASLGAPTAPKQPQQVASGKTITGTLSLSPALLRLARDGKIPADAVLFVLARPANSTGGPPLAAMRVPLAQVINQSAFPFKLDDSLSMNPANKLSDAKLVDVEARIAVGGSVQKQDGDLRVVVKGIKPGARDVKLQLEAQP
jgi:cytochrome c-type biogenesis protein CcmH